MSNGTVGSFRGALGLPPRSAVRDDAARRHRHRDADSRLLDGVHRRRAARRRRAVLLLPEPLLLLHAHARPGEQLPGDVRGLGGRGPLLVSAHRLLVREEERVGRGEEGLHHQPHRRLGLHPRHLPDFHDLRHARLPRRAERRGDDAGRDRAVRRAVVHLPAPVHRRDRQERADPALRLAAGRDGRPDARLGAHPRGDDGDRGRLHGGPQRRPVFARADGDDDRRDRRRADGAHGGVDRPRAERHQAGAGVLDRVAARLHVHRHGRRRLCGRRVPSDDARLLQGAAVPRERLGHSRDGRRAGHAAHGRPEEVHARHLRDDVHRHARDCGHSAAVRVLQQGRDSLQGVSAATRPSGFWRSSRRS